MNLQLFNLPTNSMAVCGDMVNKKDSHFDEELCRRWMQLIPCLSVAVVSESLVEKLGSEMLAFLD